MNSHTDMNQAQSSRLRLRVTAAAEARVRQGHPWLFAESILEQKRSARAQVPLSQRRAGELQRKPLDGMQHGTAHPSPLPFRRGEGESSPGSGVARAAGSSIGDLAVIYGRTNKFLAIGLYDPDSPIRVRLLHTGKPQPINSAWWTRRLLEALDRRRGLFDNQTTGYRWINGESDGWPGLVLDRYEETLVIKLYTAAWLPHLDEVLPVIIRQLSPRQIILRLSRNIQSIARERFGRADGDLLAGMPLKGPVIFRENGLRFEADVIHGQKTGFFLDQRENRKRVEALGAGRSVLNAFSFSGGFSLYSARGGAKSVTDLDISAHALKAAARNFTLNQDVAPVAACKRTQIQADAFEWLSANAQRRFDLVILDPPSFAKREAERASALNGYRRLVSHSLNHVSAGGILVACSCSAHVSAGEFFEAVRGPAAGSRRKFDELLTTGHAPDHPATFKEAHYLKAIFLRFGRSE